MSIVEIRMKKQSIKSLKEQANSVDFGDFSITNFSSGDYGYNCIEGVFISGVELVLRVPYLKEDDKEATTKIFNCFNNCKQFIERIFVPLTTHKFKKLDDGNLVLYLQAEYNIDGHIFNIHIPNCEVSKERYIPPRIFDWEELVKTSIDVTKKSIANFEAILNAKVFKLERFEEAESMDGTYYKFTGITRKVTGYFTIKKDDFAKVNIKKTLKAELKKIKKLTNNPASNTQGVIDLRNYPELVEVHKKHEKIVNASYANERRKNWQEYHDKWVVYDNDVYSKVIFETLSIINPKIIFWRTGEVFSFSEIYGEDFEQLADDRFLKRGYDSSKIHSKGEMQGLIETSNEYILVDEIICFEGKTNAQREKELLELGQKPEHNISSAYMYIRDDNIIADTNNQIIYNDRPVYYDPKKPLSNEVKQMHRDANIRNFKKAEHRLTYNYKIFKTPQELYMANSMIAIYAAFNGNLIKAKDYKSRALKIKNAEHDPKLTKLLSAI